MRVRSERTAYVRAFIPIQTQPTKVFVHCLNKFRLASLVIEIFIAEDELAGRRPDALVGDPEGTRVSQVEVARGRRSKTAPDFVVVSHALKLNLPRQSHHAFNVKRLREEVDQAYFFHAVAAFEKHAQVAGQSGGIA